MDRPRTENWGISAELRPLPGGHRNVAFRTFGLGQDLVFKSTSRTPEALAWLPAVHDRARDAGFLVPRLRESREGTLLADGWTCEPFIEGRPLTAAEMPGLLSRLADFHDRAADLPQRPGFRSSLSLLHAESGGDVDLGAMPPALAQACREAWRTVADRRETVIHGDLSLGNVLQTADGRFALLDWDESRRDLALFDRGELEPDDDAGQRARLCWEIACSWSLEPAYAQALASRM